MALKCECGAVQLSECVCWLPLQLRELADKDGLALLDLAADEIERLRSDVETLLRCRRGEQRCHICPDVECNDNCNLAPLEVAKGADDE